MYYFKIKGFTIQIDLNNSDFSKRLSLLVYGWTYMSR